LSSDLIRAGANHLLVQAESSSTIHLHCVLSRIRGLGAKAGVVLDPGEPDMTFNNCARELKAQHRKYLAKKQQ
jgi:pentose-5-phosphate-3-epimerase